MDLGKFNGRIISSTMRKLTSRGLEASSTTVPAGSLVVSTRAPIGYVVQTIQDLAFNQGCRGLVPKRPIDVRYYRYTLAALTKDLSSRGEGSTFLELSSDALASAAVSQPPECAQRAIADFLDTETARIDALIARRLQLDKLLEMRWHARVRAVAVDSRWPMVSLRRLWAVTDCKHRTPEYVDSGFPVVSPGDVEPGRLDLRRCHRFVDEPDFVNLTEDDRLPRRGDIVYSRNASIGLAALVDTDEKFTMGQDVCLIRSEGQDERWLMYMLNSVGMDQLAEMKIGSTFDRVNIAQLLDLQIPAPPLDLQISVGQQLDDERLLVDRLHTIAHAQIALLQERRQALITAAVTGELDIPGVAA